MEQERWTDITIPGLDNKYQVSTMGQIKRLAYDVVSQRNGTEYIMHKNEMFVKLQNQKYQIVMLMVNGKQKAFYVHRLVAQAFIPNPDNLPEVNHINEDKYDNRVENLEWCTRKYNINYGTGKERGRQTQVNNGRWSDYSECTEEEKKEAQKRLRKDWYHKNKEHLKEYRENNKQRLKGYSEKYREKNKDKVKGWRKKTYENNKKHYLDYQKEYRQQHYQKKLDHTVYVYKLVNRYELVGVYDNYSTAADLIGVSSSTIKNRIDNNSLKQVKNYVVSKETLN